jgi:hypothetical protein
MSDTRSKVIEMLSGFSDIMEEDLENDDIVERECMISASKLMRTASLMLSGEEPVDNVTDEEFDVMMNKIIK